MGLYSLLQVKSLVLNSWFALVDIYMKQKYVVIVGDVIKSGSAKDRKEYWNKLQGVVNKVNEKYKEFFYAPMMIIKGDEITAVLHHGEQSYAILRFFQEEFYPYQIRFASVKGVIDVGIKTKNASIMDGEAFWKADDHLESIKKERKYFYFDFGNELLDEVISSMTSLLAHLKSRWSEKERMIIVLYEKYGNQMDAAEKCGITQQGVSDALKRSYWREIRENEKIIEKVLKSYVGEYDAF